MYSYKHRIYHDDLRTRLHAQSGYNPICFCQAAVAWAARAGAVTRDAAGADWVRPCGSAPGWKNNVTHAVSQAPRWATSENLASRLTQLQCTQQATSHGEHETWYNSSNHDWSATASYYNTWIVAGIVSQATSSGEGCLLDLDL